MPDILSQEEIDALLTANDPELRELFEGLKKLKIEKYQYLGFSRFLDSLAHQDKKLGELEPAALNEVKLLLKGKRVSSKVRGDLNQHALKALGHKADEHRKKHEDARPQERIVTRYDFKHPARVNKTQLRTLENLHDNFARLLSSTFSGANRTVVDVNTAFVDQTTYAEFIMSLSNPSCSYQFTLGPTKGQAIIDLSLPIVWSFVDKICGGKGSPEGMEARQLTPIEIGIINRICKRMIEDLEATWEPVLRVEISDIELETNPEFMQITAASEIVILLAFEVNTPHASGLLSLCYPFFTLESILPRLGQQTYVRRARGPRDELHLKNRLRLAAMEVPMVAELGRTSISLAEANSLGEGDIIRLDSRTADPLPLYAGGKAKYLARPFAEDDGEVKLSIAGKIPPELQKKYGVAGE